jgi:flagellar motor switch protein FliN
MADEKMISQDDIEKLLSQGPGKAASAGPAQAQTAGNSTSEEDRSANNQAGPDASAASSHDADVAMQPAQEDIEKLLSQAGNPSPAARPKTAKQESPAESLIGEGGMAEKDIEYLLNQAEQALESIGSSAKNDMPQGVSAFQLTDLNGAPPSTESATLDLVRDVELNLKIELGRTHMYLEDVLKLRKGSVVPLDKLAGDPVDIYVNGRLVARGEVLVLNDNFCVRIAELIAGVNLFN